MTHRKTLWGTAELRCLWVVERRTARGLKGRQGYSISCQLGSERTGLAPERSASLWVAFGKSLNILTTHLLSQQPPKSKGLLMVSLFSFVA